MMTYSVLMNTTASLVGASCFFSDAKVRIIMFIFQKEHLHLEKMTKNINSQSEFILKNTIFAHQYLKKHHYHV